MFMYNPSAQKVISAEATFYICHAHDFRKSHLLERIPKSVKRLSEKMCVKTND
ncbi:hypothetical protein CEV33_2273 [Brucella grignonensis]|uniref:Uncharacterized protein n=1 Tax=Brucella grignonensis TaxID=94627 RepID=A0A256F7G0_9HYPH|nr:hypothetical protein CEV33_2273 [Brucella grignonensis]